MSTASPPTRTHWADARLRQAILTGELAPGARLRAEHLAGTFGVSPTPLREAFQRLAGEGLVVIEPQRGARVAPIDAHSAAELYDVRLLIEPQALETSVVAGADDTAWHAEVAAAYERLCGPPTDLVAALAAHRDFHLALLARCPNRRLLALIGQLHDQSERFQIVGAVKLARGSADNDHRELADAARAGDDARAAGVLRRHLVAVRDAIVRSATAG